MRRKVVLQQRKVRHAGVLEGRELLVAVFCYDEVAPPSVVLAIVLALYLLEALVDWERHAVPRDHGIVYDIRVRKPFVHPIQRGDNLSRYGGGEE